jgi:3-oxoacyl-[acyl-carrier protein] reductase
VATATENESLRRVLVTGASRGIGRAIAVQLASDGFAVTLNYHRSDAAAEAAAKEIRERGGAASLLRFDIGDREAAAVALAADVGADGAYYGIVLNAGIHRDAAFPAMKGDDWDAVLRTNLGGFQHVIAPLVMPMLRLRCGGRIVTLSSIAGQTGNRGQVNYAASKAGLIGATKSLAQELAKRQVTVNCVSPGWIDTEMLGELDREALAKAVPLQRLGRPEDVAACVSFLFSDRASYITGQVIAVNGGML